MFHPMGAGHDHPRFHADYRSDIDGDRFVIVDAAHYDMAGWKIEVRDLPRQRDGERFGWINDARDEDLDPATSSIEEFTRDRTWFGGGKGRGWNGLGFGTAGNPWCAPCNHGRRVVRWIPPDPEAVH